MLANKLARGSLLHTEINGSSDSTGIAYSSVSGKQRLNCIAESYSSAFNDLGLSLELVDSERVKCEACWPTASRDGSLRFTPIAAVEKQCGKRSLNNVFRSVCLNESSRVSIVAEVKVPRLNMGKAVELNWYVRSRKERRAHRHFIAIWRLSEVEEISGAVTPDRMVHCLNEVRRPIQHEPAIYSFAAVLENPGLNVPVAVAFRPQLPDRNERDFLDRRIRVERPCKARNPRVIDRKFPKFRFDRGHIDPLVCAGLGKSRERSKRNSDRCYIRRCSIVRRCSPSSIDLNRAAHSAFRCGLTACTINRITVSSSRVNPERVRMCH